MESDGCPSPSRGSVPTEPRFPPNGTLEAPLPPVRGFFFRCWCVIGKREHEHNREGGADRGHRALHRLAPVGLVDAIGSRWNSATKGAVEKKGARRLGGGFRAAQRA